MIADKIIRDGSFVLIIALGLVIGGCVRASSNNTLTPSLTATRSQKPVMPAVEVADLEGKVYKLPGEFPNDFNLLVFGFAHEQKDATQAWIDAVSGLATSNPSLSLFKVPVIDNSTAALRAMIRNGMRMGITDKDARQRTLTLFVNKAPLMESLGVSDDTQPAAILFARDGSVLWHESGAADELKVARLRASLANPR